MENKTQKNPQTQKAWGFSILYKKEIIKFFPLQ